MARKIIYIVSGLIVSSSWWPSCAILIDANKFTPQLGHAGTPEGRDLGPVADPARSGHRQSLHRRHLHGRDQPPPNNSKRDSSLRGPSRW